MFLAGCTVFHGHGVLHRRRRGLILQGGLALEKHWVYTQGAEHDCHVFFAYVVAGLVWLVWFLLHDVLAALDGRVCGETAFLRQQPTQQAAEVEACFSGSQFGVGWSGTTGQVSGNEWRFGGSCNAVM